ncbi:MAG: hypothetical protein WAU91_19180 [Desulfatitalea sp.]
MFGIDKMGLYKHTHKRYVRSTDRNGDIKRLIDQLYFKSRTHFSNVLAGDKVIVFTNSIFRNLFTNYEKFGEISEGVVNFEPKENYFIVHSKVSFARFLFIYGLIFVIGLPLIFWFEGILLFAIIAGLSSLGFIVISAQFAALKFNTMIKTCIEECNLKME